MKVLIVDDSSTIRRIVINALGSGRGLEILEAGDGLEGLALINKHKDIGLILCDWNMPNLDGYKMLCKFREDNKETPIIMVTTEAEKDNILKAIKAGATSYVVKPFTPEVLLEKVGPYLPAATS